MPISQLILALATIGANLYTTIQGQSNKPNIVAALLPIISMVTSSAQRVSDTLAQAQVEGWTDDDPRWGPIFDEAHRVLEAAEKSLD